MTLGQQSEVGNQRPKLSPWQTLLEHVCPGWKSPESSLMLWKEHRAKSSETASGSEKGQVMVLRSASAGSLSQEVTEIRRTMNVKLSQNCKPHIVSLKAAIPALCI